MTKHAPERYESSMVERYSLVALENEMSQRSRNDNIARHSSGFRYWFAAGLFALGGAMSFYILLVKAAVADAFDRYRYEKAQRRLR